MRDDNDDDDDNNKKVNLKLSSYRSITAPEASRNLRLPHFQTFGKRRW